MSEDPSTNAFWFSLNASVVDKIAADHLVFEEKLRALMEKDSAHSDFYGAVLSARNSAKRDEDPETLGEDFEYKFTPNQVIQTTRLAREDIEAVKIIQLSTLKRLDRIHQFNVAGIQRLDNVVARLDNLATSARRNHRFTWVAMGLLLYIAIRLS
jgi:hypothetical protein